MKKAITLIITLFTILFVSFAIISFMYYSSSNQISQYQKDLTELRGYWAAYGAKERDDANDILYYYHYLSSNTQIGVDDKFLYIMRGVRTSDTESTFTIWDSQKDNANVIGISDIYTRTLKITNDNEYNNIESYK